MIRLSNRVPQTLQLITTQNGADVSVSYSDNTNTQSGGTQNSLIASATTSTICATPPLLNQTYEVVRAIDRISILNTFNGTHTITVQIGEGSASYPLLIVTLNYQDALIFNDNTGWQVLDSSGNLKTVLGPTSALNIHSAPNKTTPVAADEVGIWDSVTGFLSKVTWANIVATVWASIHTATNKTTPVGADEVGIWDSATGLLNRVSFTNMLTWFAALAGSASQVFSVAAATLGTHAMNRDTADARYDSNAQTVSVAMASNAVTISALNSVPLTFRSTTAGSGATSQVATPSANLVIPSGATLGSVNGVQSTIVIAEMNNAGTREYAVANISGGLELDEKNLISTTAISAAATAANVWYSTTSRTSLPYRIVAMFSSTQVTAGTWATAASAVQSIFGQATAQNVSMVRLNTANGYGATNTKIRRYSTIVTNQGTAITYTDSATLGASFTINTPGEYHVSVSDQFSGANILGASLNTSAPTTNLYTVPAAEILAGQTTSAANTAGSAAWSGWLNAGDVVRSHGDGAASGTNPNIAQFTISGPF